MKLRCRVFERSSRIRVLRRVWLSKVLVFVAFTVFCDWVVLTEYIDGGRHGFLFIKRLC